MLDWARHFAALGSFELAHGVLQPLREQAEGGAWDAATRFRVRRVLDALEYGSGQDHA